MGRRLGGYTETERVIAALAVTISTLLGVASVAAGLRGAHISPQRSPLPPAAAGSPFAAAPLPACAACGPDSRSAGNREQEPASTPPPAPTGGGGTDGSRSVLAAIPVGRSLPGTAAPAGGTPAGASHPTATRPPARPTGPPGGASPSAPVAPSPPGPARVASRATIVDLAPVATVASTGSTLQVGALGPAGHSAAGVSLGCGTLAVGVALGDAAATCPADQASTAVPSLPGTAAPAGTAAASTAGPVEAAAQPGLLTVDSTGGGLQVQVLPGSGGALLSLTVCTSVPGLVLTILGFRSRCGESPASTVAPAHP